MPRERITACLIVQDEQEHLPAALASVAFCDEIVVVDGGSTDATVQIARAAGARVIENAWPGYAIQRNVALDAASGDWIVEVDADERVSTALRASIEALLDDAPAGVGIALCALRQHFLSRPLGPSAKYPAYRSRIFRRARYRHDELREVHEGIEPRERPAVLAGDLEHELAPNVREAVRDMWRYARLESLHVARPNARRLLTGVVLRPAAKLAYRTVVDGGWRDGWRGMLKIALDVSSDALVWVLALARSDADAGAGNEHFGRRRVGPAKVLALAARGEPARAAAAWLAQLQARGADVVLVAPTGADDGAVRAGGAGGVAVRALARFAPLEVMRAIDVEMQVRELDAVVAFGPRARTLKRLLPATLRPTVAGLDAGTDPERAAALMELKSS